jgi:hypothetical protein
MTCPFSRNVWPGPDEKVHLVMTDELSPPNDVLGVFWSYDEANSFWTEIQGRFANRTTLVVSSRSATATTVAPITHGAWSPPTEADVR